MPYDPNRVRKVMEPDAQPEIPIIQPNASSVPNEPGVNEITIDTPTTTGGYNPGRVNKVLQDVDADPSLLEKFKAGFMGTEVKDGGIAEIAGKYGLEFVGGLAGSLASPVAGTGLGAGIGKTVHNVGKQLAGGEVEHPVLEPMIETGTNMLGAKVLPPVAKAGIEAASKGAGWIGKNLLAPPVRAIAGVSKEAMDQLIEAPGKVLKYVGEAPDALHGYAEAFVDAIHANATKAGNAYWKLINDTVRTNKKYGQFKVDLFNGELSNNISSGLKRMLKSAGVEGTPQVSDIVKGVYHEFGFGRAGRINDEAETKLFNMFATALPKLENASLEAVYYFQKDLTKAIAKNTDAFGNKSPVGVALSYLKEGVIDHISGRVPEMAKANKLYAISMDLTERLGKVLRADNPARVMVAALKGKTNTGKAIAEAATKAANARKALEGIKYGGAAQEFTPWVKSPATSPRLAGYAAGAVSGAKTMAVNAANSKASAAVGKAAAVGSSNIASERSSYKLPGDVKSAFKRGDITEDEAFSILSKQFPRYFK